MIEDSLIRLSERDIFIFFVRLHYKTASDNIVHILFTSILKIAIFRLVIAEYTV